MNYKTGYFKSKPDNCVAPNEQLFSYDVNDVNCKNYFIGTYDEVYAEMKYNKHYYEDHSYNNNIKLHLDIDKNEIFTTELERDKNAEIIIDDCLNAVNKKLYEVYKIINPRIIIFISNTLNKLSLHLIYPDIVFNSIYDMKFLLHNVSLHLDMSIYGHRCFRLPFNSKKGKNNELIFFKGIYYNKPDDNFQLFLDGSLCSNKPNNKYSYISNIITTINKENKSIQKNISIPSILRNYIYKKYNLDKVKEALEILKTKINDYTFWLTISFSIKDLWLSISKDDKKKLYKIYDNVCKQNINYNKTNNKNIFKSLNPIIDINYIFNLADMKYFIHPFYNYKEIIFNINNHKNHIIQDSQYINVNINELIKYKTIYIKSPTGTGKTTILKNIIDKLNIQNILSITSRTNLAGEHTKNMDLKFYKDLDYIGYINATKLVCQLESIWKISYKNFIGCVLILDELNSLLSHLRSPTLNNIRSKCYSYLIEVIKNAKYIIGLDADLSDWNIEFINNIKNDNYIVYYNSCKNKANIPATFYINDQVVIDKMTNDIKSNNFFVASFDSLTKMKIIIDYLAQFGKKDKWLIYSSEVNYTLIDTSTWANKFVFFSPTILYGIDYNEIPTNVYSFIYKFHLNPLQVYQMISRTRQIKECHIYCQEKIFYPRYKSIEDVKQEFNLFKLNFGSLISNYQQFCITNEEPYNIMYFNFKYMDSLLKTNIKDYLIDLMEERGFIVKYDNNIIGSKINKTNTKDVIRDRIINLLNLDKDKLTPLENELATKDRKLEKHFNLRIFMGDNLDDKITLSIEKNLFTETIKNKLSKIKICQELMRILSIDKLENINKELSKKYTNKINDEWLTNNLESIKKLFDLRGNKYNNYTYYTIYLLLITILKNLFDENIFIGKYIKINKKQYYYYKINTDLLKEHSLISQKIDKIEFID